MHRSMAVYGLSSWDSSRGGEALLPESTDLPHCSITQQPPCASPASSGEGWEERDVRRKVKVGYTRRHMRHGSGPRKESPGGGTQDPLTPSKSPSMTSTGSSSHVLNEKSKWSWEPNTRKHPQMTLTRVVP